MLIGLTQTYPDGSEHYGEYRIGGTSVASPLFAGMTALLLQHAGGSRLGLLNPTIYHQFGSKSFTDIQGTPPNAGNVRVDYANGVDPTDGLVYSVRTFNQDSSLQIAPGWDDVTGIGSPNANWLTSVSP
jgi:subtilase family serine protease